MILKKNDIINLKITSTAAQGSGVGRTDDGMAVFVPAAALGDVLSVRILKVKKSYAFGKAEAIVTASPFRVLPDCESYLKCGGCAWRHIAYDEECRLKRQAVEDSLKRIGGVENPVVRPIIKSARIERYRNKAQYPVGLDKNGNVIAGFYSFHSHRIVNCPDCVLQPKIFSRVVDVTKSFVKKTGCSVYDERTGRGRLRHIYARLGEITDELMVCYVVNSNGLKSEDLLVKMLKDAFPNLKTVIVNSNRENTNVVLGKKNRTIYGSGYITDELCGLKFRISPFSFWQVNRTQAEKLYAKAKEYASLRHDEALLDLYCGIGTIGLTMAQSCGTLIGAEVIKDAVRDAEINAELNSIGNARFICADACEAAKRLNDEGLRPDCVILDPPRKGCGGGLVDIVCKMSPKRIVYVSCDHATFARDLNFFMKNGYFLKEATPCDMFSRTAHVETVALITKKDK